MKSYLPKILLSSLMILLLPGLLISKEHPTLVITAAEASAIRESMGKYPLLDASFEQVHLMVEAALKQQIEVPPPGESGGYSHERHKQNYREMQGAGVLFSITGEERYAIFVRDMLNAYAEMYPKLGPHPLSYNQKPGRLFHQTLNEEVWLVNVAQAYDCIYNWLSAEERRKFEQNIFNPMIHLFSVEHAEEFDRIHNHGTWAVAAVGMMAYVMDKPDLVEKALYGSKKDGNGGFLQQLDLLFSPDGYYMEGPYYIRYALRPFFLFADAIEHHEPQRKIFEYRDHILKKVFYSAAQTVFPNGVFPPINDASRTMDIVDIGPLIANNITYERYGATDPLLSIAKMQQQVMLNGAGLKIARAVGDGQNVPELTLGSIEFSDGFDGQKGGLGILRTGEGLDQSVLLMKYGVHGKGHGHFDKLHFIFYDQRREVVPDYGFSRWINIEPKFGGRYLPENDSYAKQTLAHNTVVVDGQSQNQANRKEADQRWAERHFFDATRPEAQVMSARSNQQYPGVSMQRTLFLINHAQFDYPFVLDLYRLASRENHQYDYPIHLRGQFIHQNFELQSFTTSQQPLGEENGYQHIWKTATAKHDDLAQLTWLDGHRYYTLSVAGAAGSEVFLGRTGANDPHNNLISEPLILVRRNAATHLFAATIEPHGFFNEAREISRNARPLISSLEVIGHDETASVVEIKSQKGFSIRIMVNNGPADDEAIHSVTFNNRTFSWRGNYSIDFQE